MLDSALKQAFGQDCHRGNSSVSHTVERVDMNPYVQHPPPNLHAPSIPEPLSKPNNPNCSPDLRENASSTHRPFARETDQHPSTLPQSSPPPHSSYLPTPSPNPVQ